MTKTVKFIFLTTILLGWSSQCTPNRQEESSRQLTFQITIPFLALDLGDLDVRDANNRSVKSFVIQHQMRRLFISNLRDMLLENLTPSKRITLAFLSKSWDLVSGWLRHATKTIAIKATAWLKENKIKFHLLVGNLECESQVHLEGFYPNSNRQSFQFLVSLILSSTCLLR